MNKKVLVSFAILSVILLSSFLSGCVSYLALPGTKFGEIESFPKASGVESKTILYSDDFAKSNNNWDTGSWNNGGSDYYNGGYRINVPSGENISAYLHQSFQKDVIVEVDVTTIGKESYNKGLWAGIYVRHTSDDSSYWLTIQRDSDNGTASIVALHQGSGPDIATIKKNWKWPKSWGETYHIRVDCIGDQISLYVNGYLVERAIDSTISSGGEIGFFGGRETGAKQYLFDNLVVYAADKEAFAAPNSEGAINEKETVATESSDAVKMAPTINLSISEGPIIEGSICYYRVKATFTGSPVPTVNFSKDDSGGAWGTKKVQINLNYPGDSYTLNATAINSEGSDKDSITLSW